MDYDDNLKNLIKEMNKGSTMFYLISENNKVKVICIDVSLGKSYTALTATVLQIMILILFLIAVILRIGVY